MKRLMVFGWLMLACLLPEKGHAEVLSLRQAERLALERNLELQSGVLGYQAAFVSIDENRGFVYDPRLRLLAATGEVRALNTVTPFVSRDSRYVQFDLALNQVFATGASLGFEFDNRRDDVRERTVIGDNPIWSSTLRLSLVQPLLKGFGRTVTEEPILLAVKGHEAAAAALRQRAVTTLTQVRTLYYDIRRAREVVAFREASVTLAGRVQEESRARVSAGVLPPIDILEAEVGLKLRERDLLDAQQAYQELLDRLAEQLNLLERAEVDDVPFAAELFAPEEQSDLASAWEQRPDLNQARFELERLEIEEKTAKNRRLPALDLSAAYAQQGVADTYDADLEQALTDDLRNWEIGLTFTYPLGNRQAANEALRKKYLTESGRRDFERLRESVRREVRVAIRQLQVGQARLTVTAEGVMLAEEKLKTLFKRRDVGLATTRDVLEGEAELARARTDSADAQTTYAGAVTEYLRSTGRLLEHDGVVVTTDTATPKLLGPNAP